MPTFFSHAIAATALGAVMVAGPSRARLWMLGAVCAVVPDLDVITMQQFGIPYRAMLGHRGLSHSLLFAAALASVVTPLMLRKGAGRPKAWTLWLFFFLVTASHGVLDAMTTGGLGVAFFAPFSDTRYFLPWRPIIVSPISIRAFFGHDGLVRLWNEMGWVWLPAAVVFLVGLALHRSQRPPGATSRRLPSGDRSRGRRGSS